MVEPPSPRSDGPSPPAPGRSRGDLIAWASTFLLGALHGAVIWVGLGGRAGIASEWPILTVDHGFHYHHGVLSREFLRATGMSAGYDPSFMAGYPMSVISGLSSTLTNVAILAFGGDRPAVAYKVQVFLCVALVPWLVALAGAIARSGARAVAFSVALYLIYFWTDFPCIYAQSGMTAYLLSVPLGLVATGLLAAYLARGGPGRWLAATLACSAVFLVHVTGAMIVGPAGLAAYAVAVARARREGRPFPGSRHAGLAAMAPIILLANLFWWLPGYWLASTAGRRDFAFTHPESVLGRIGGIAWSEAPIEATALGLGLAGLASLARRNPVAAAGVGGFLAAGFGWGYLAGASRSLDMLQAGRHTYVYFTAACLAGGIALDEILARLRSSGPGHLDRWAFVALALVAVRSYGPSAANSLRWRVGGPDTFLSSRPTPALLWIVAGVRKHVRPGERLLYEETGFNDAERLGDPFGERHFSPILPHLAGVEVIGGPYLHTPVRANFTQFGEDRLFGRRDWDRDFFVRYARLYRPAAICCWSPASRRFCLANPDLIRVVEDDGTLLIARVIGFEGATIRGSARVEAGPNRLIVRDAVADADGLVVLRYHAVPYLATDPPVAIEPVQLEDDPVPFIGLRPTQGPVTIRMALPHLARPKG